MCVFGKVLIGGFSLIGVSSFAEGGDVGGGIFLVVLLIGSFLLLNMFLLLLRLLKVSIIPYN